MNHIKKIIFLTVAVIAIFCSTTLAVSAADDSGTCGYYSDTLTWSFDASSGTITISGTGKMANYSSLKPPPWSKWQQDITTVVVEEGALSVGSMAFSGCGNLTSISMPDSLEAIGGGAYYGCDALKTVTIPCNVSLIGDATFGFCTSLESIVVAEGNQDYHVIDNVLYTTDMSKLVTYCLAKPDLTYVIPDGVVTVGHTAFGKSTLTAVTLPDSIITLEDDSFFGCANLATINFPDGLTTMGKNSFSYCDSLISVYLPDSVTSMNNVFLGCAGLTSIHMSEGLTTIDDWAFLNCPNLTTINIPEGVTSIGEYAFQLCSSLVTVELPDGITSIGDFAFDRCTNLVAINVPSDLETLGTFVFRYCDNLTDVYYSGSKSQMDAITVKGILQGSTSIFSKDSPFYVDEPEAELTMADYFTTCNVHYNSTMTDSPSVTTPVTTVVVEPTSSAVIALPSSTKLMVNGEDVAVDAYLIEDSNYIKLRDLAAMVNGTEKNFEVEWNQALQAIEMSSQTSYTVIGGELEMSESDSLSATLSTASIYCDGQLVDLIAYTINGNNYFKLRTIMELFDIGVDYDSDTNTSILNTSNSYVN